VQRKARQRKEIGLDIGDLQPWANLCNALWLTRNEQESGSGPLVGSLSSIARVGVHGREGDVQGAEARLVLTTPSSHGGLPMFAIIYPSWASSLLWPAGVSETPQYPILRSSLRLGTRSP
jgi:hypothetical protein